MAVVQFKGRSKYRAIPTIIDGIRFASKLEAKRYSELKLMERGNQISDLKLQPKFELRVNGNLICTYVADFDYFDQRTPKPMRIIEDTKGFPTPEYKIKRRLFETLYPNLRVTEVRA